MCWRRRKRKNSCIGAEAFYSLQFISGADTGARKTSDQPCTYIVTGTNTQCTELKGSATSSSSIRMLFLVKNLTLPKVSEWANGGMGFTSSIVPGPRILVTNIYENAFFHRPGFSSVAWVVGACYIHFKQLWNKRMLMKWPVLKFCWGIQDKPDFHSIPCVNHSQWRKKCYYCLCPSSSSFSFLCLPWFPSRPSSSCSPKYLGVQHICNLNSERPSFENSCWNFICSDPVCWSQMIPLVRIQKCIFIIYIMMLKPERGG